MSLQFLCATAQDIRPLPVFVNLAAEKKQTVIVYGTSLTAGGEWTREMKRWFDKRYPKQVKFLNSGGSGMNSDWGLENLEDKVLTHSPDLVFIEFSYNDAAEKFKLSTDKAARNLDGIVAGIQKRNHQATVVLQIMNLPWDAPNGKGSKSSRPKLDDFNAIYLAAAKTKGLPLLNHWVTWTKLMKDDPDNYHSSVPDGSHPNKEASLAVTWPALREWLKKSAETATQGK
jgi:acyl-CoA thioesterase-1